MVDLRGIRFLLGNLQAIVTSKDGLTHTRRLEKPKALRFLFATLKAANRFPTANPIWEPDDG
jgi:hypothetical protein